MIPKQEEHFLNRFTLALNRPPQFRCAELRVLFDRATIKDLHTIFPTLVENIFGHHGCACWDLQIITNETHPQDFQALLHFLSPVGPLFKVIYTLLRDPLLKYDYGLNFLPEKLRQNLEHLRMHPFYSDIIRVDTQRNYIVALSLNPFDYYMFHFAYHAIDPFYQQRNRISSTIKTWGSLYYSLCCDYILHFLPTDPSNSVMPPLHGYNGKNPLYTIPLFKQQTLSPAMIKMPVVEHHPRNEIWRSETVMTVFIDIWLNSDQVLMSGYDFGGSFNMSTIYPYKPKLNINEMPTGEYIRIIRVLIKQLHSFASSAKADDTHMRELKRIVLPYLQGKMYTFLRHLIYRWPLDGSFRLVLELWLSYIQPWRYPGNEYLKIQNHDIVSDIEEVSNVPVRTVDREHMKFLADNLLCYTVILQQLLPRFTRVDLSSPKLALILFRLTKVFSQPNLIQYLREIESNYDTTDASPVHSTAILNCTQNLPPLSPTSAWSLSIPQNQNTPHLMKPQSPEINSTTACRLTGKWYSIIKQKTLELEGPNFYYKPIFTSPPAPEVYSLVNHIKQSECTAQSIIKSKLEELQEKNKGFIGKLKTFFMLNEYSNDEFTLDDRRKVPVYLQTSLQNLADIFQIPDYATLNRFEDFGTAHSVATTPRDFGALLTPKRVLERIKHIKYEGDPDLHPIRSNENKLMVRLLYQCSSRINQQFGTEINNIYYRNNWLGQIARQVLCPPLTVYKYEKSEPGLSPRIANCLPPRFSFRQFGGNQFLFYAIIVIFFSKVLTCNYYYFPSLIVAAWFFYICIKAILFHNNSVRNTDTQEDHFTEASENISLGASFY